MDSEAVYLAADSAVSRLGNPRILRHDYSSFGEMQYQGSVRTVEESALKILRHQNVAAAFSGDVSGMNDLFTNFIQGSHFMLTREAFDAAWVSSQGGEKKLWALLGYHDQAGPHLFKYDPTTVSGEETRSDCIGYLNEDDKQFLREMLPQTLKQTSVRDRLVSTACRIQRPGMFLNLMESHGIGGHIAGCSIDKDGLR